MERADQIRISSALGWLELGLPAESEKELDSVSPDLQTRPEVLAVRWSVLAAKNQWEKALAIAEKLVDAAPDDPVGWLNQSYSLHELKRTAEAWNQLIHVAGKFPETSTIPYNLACYACVLGRLDEARKWLHRAVKIGGVESIKSIALTDPDLEALRDEIKKL